MARYKWHLSTNSPQVLSMRNPRGVLVVCEANVSISIYLYVWQVSVWEAEGYYSGDKGRAARKADLQH